MPITRLKGSTLFAPAPNLTDHCHNRGLHILQIDVHRSRTRARAPLNMGDGLQAVSEPLQMFNTQDLLTLVPDLQGSRVTVGFTMLHCWYKLD